MAPYEADAQIAFLIKEDYADFAISEDSDLLAFGCAKVMFKLQSSGIGQLVELDMVLEYLSMTMEQFTDMCIAAGCDYLSNIRGTGINKANKIICDNNNYLDVFQRLQHAPANYKELFKQTRSVFHHQTVVDPATYKVVPLCGWNGITTDEETQHMCGNLLDEHFPQNLTAGNVDPKDGEVKGTVDVHTKVSESEKCSGRQKQDETQDTKTPWNVTITSVEKDSFPWTIPDFPVITLNFQKVRFQYNSKETIGLVNKDETIDTGNYICTDHCTIIVNEQQYTVLWLLLPDGQKRHEPISTIEQTGAKVRESSVNGATNTTYTLPFKVLGTCYSKERQVSLDSALNYIDNNRSVFVDLVCEPENKYDINAIAVHVMSEGEFEKVGYIAREVSVKTIRFQTNFLRVGYYLTIDITKQGNWDDAVIAASKKIK